MSEQPPKPSRGPAASDDELDMLFEIASAVVRRGDATVDVDRAITMASAAVERRRRRRLALLRVAGLTVILAVLLVWIVGYSKGGGDILYTVVMFAVPAIVVLRWYLESLDGGGLRPWRTPPTVVAWSREVTDRVGWLTEAIALLDQVSLGLEVPSGIRPARGDESVLAVQSDLGRLRAGFADCRAGAGGFIASCRSSPGEANWSLLRQVDPDTVSTILRRSFGRLRSPVLSPDFAGTPELNAAMRRAELLVPTVGRRCADLVEAFDNLHRIATQETLQHAMTLNAVRRATSSAAVVASGLGRSAVQRSAIRNVLLAEALSGGPLWWHAVRRARAVGSAQVLALSGAF